MPTFLLIGIPVAVALLLWAILSLPDDEPEAGEESSKVDDSKTTSSKPFKKPAKKKKK